MKFTGEFTVAADQTTVFDKLNDPQFFASCLEGVHDLQEIDATHYSATLETRIAYMKFRFAIAVEIEGKERPNRVVAKGEGKPAGVVGRLTATATANLDSVPEGTRVQYEIDVALTGKLGAIGQPVLKSKAKEMERQFVKNVNAAFAPAEMVEPG
jgi:carbon monoxide dehydrogenase subunit G